MQAARRSPRSVAVDEIQQEVGLPPVTADTCARSTDQARSLSVIRSQAGPVALSIRRAWYSFFAALWRRPGEPVLLTGPADDRSGSYARPRVALLICPVSQRARGLASGAATPAMSLGVPRRPSRMTCSGPSAGWAWDLCLYLVCPLPGLMGSDAGCRSVQAPWFIDLPSISLDSEDPGAGETADGPARGCVRPGWRPHRTEPGFRGRE